MWRIIIAALCIAAQISAQASKDAPINCVLNEKRPNPSNQNTFYHCRADGPVLMKCGENMYFDNIKLECAKISTQTQPTNNVSVAKVPPPPGWQSGPPPPGWQSGPPPPGWQSGPPPPGWQSPPPPPGWSPAPSGWTPTPPPSGWTTPTDSGWTGGWGSLTTTTVKPIEPVGTCPAAETGWLPTPTYLADQNDCSVFYECANGVPIQLSCPAGLYFNLLAVPGPTCDYVEDNTEKMDYRIQCGAGRLTNLQFYLNNLEKSKAKNVV